MRKYAVFGFMLGALILPVLASASSCPNLTRNLLFGSRGQDVVQLQNFLIDQRDLTAGNNTGYFGRLTEAAVKSFQRRNNIVSSGTPATTGYGAVGPRTRAAIARVCATTSSASVTPPPNPPTTPPPITITPPVIVPPPNPPSTPPSCTPLAPQTQTLACPSGQTGSITQTRTSSCPGPTWGVWQTTANTCQTAIDSRPNIVVIMTDDQDDTGSIDFMPQVQQLLISKGTRFTNSFVDFSLCCPSRASFLTGQAAHNHGILAIALPIGGYGKFIPQEGNTLPVWLQNAGYDTAVIGKYLNSYGVESSETHAPPGWSNYQLFEQSPALLYYGYRMNENGVVKTYGTTDADYQTDVLTKKATDYIASQQTSSKPFFLWLTPHAPHNDGGISDTGPTLADSPQVAPRHRGAFTNQPLPMPPNFNEADVSDKPGHVAARPLLTSADIARTTANYRGRLASNLALDDMVAKVVAELQRTGKLDSTVIVYTSDNGWADGQHRYIYGKQEVYDEILRVPLIIRGPSVPQGQTRPQLVNNLDLVATIVDLTRITPGHAPDGRSLMPVFADQNAPWRTALFVEGDDVPGIAAGTVGHFMAVRTLNYLFAEHTSSQYGNEKEFYDLSKDPYELQSKPNDSGYTSTVSGLQSILATLKSCAGGNCFVTTPEPVAPVTPLPTATLTQSLEQTSSDGTTGQQFTISWSSTNANSCIVAKSKPDGTIVNPWSTGTATSGTQPAGAVPIGIHHWWIDCTGPGGTAHQDIYHTVIHS